MTQKSIENDTEKLEDLEQLLNNALNEFNNPTSLLNDATADNQRNDALPNQSEDLNDLTNAFKKLMDSSNDHGFDETMLETLKKLEEDIKGLPECGKDEMPSEEEMAMIWGQASNQSNNGDNVFPPFFLDILQKLLAKDVLYPPLKDLSNKLSDWLKENKEKLSDEESTRFSKQSELVDEICSYYEEETSDGSIENARFEKILKAMQEMQQCGLPPAEITGHNSDGLPFQPISMEDFNKLMEDSGKMGDQCKTM